MSLWHGRHARRTSLLASGALEGRERERALDHLARCPRCRHDHAQTLALVTVLTADPLRSAEPELAPAALLGRIERELARRAAPAETRTRATTQRWLVALPALAAVFALVAVLPILLERLRQPAAPARASIPPPEATTLVSEDALRRIERNLAREHAARYLNEAGEVIVAVAASAADCEQANGRLDVGQAPERSRQLLEKRRVLVEAGGEAVASARGVLNDVEMALRDVAGLPSCVRASDVERLRRQVDRRQLLMRIRLMTRELEG